MTQEQAKLTLTEVEFVLSTHGVDTNCDCTEAKFARALLASQMALRQARSDLIAAGMFDSAKDVEAALLEKGDGNGVHL